MFSQDKNQIVYNGKNQKKAKRRSFKTYSAHIPSTYLHRTDINILQNYINNPTVKNKQLSEICDLPPSTLRNRLTHISKRYPLVVKGIINYQRIGLSPLLLITDNRPLIAPESRLAQYKALSWKPVFTSQFFIRSQELLDSDYPRRSGKNGPKSKSESLRLWEICYTERKMNLLNYRLFQNKWIIPWLGMREWLLQTAQQPELREFPLPNPHPELWENPLILDEIGYMTLKNLATNWHTSLRKITQLFQHERSLTISHRRKTRLLEERIISPYLEISDLQELGQALIICRNRENKHYLSIPLIAQSMLQIAREMPSYTFQVLRSLPSHKIEYAIWIDIPWQDMYNLGSVVNSIPNADQIEYYGWFQKTKQTTPDNIPASQITSILPSSTKYNFQKGRWKRFKMPQFN